MRVRVSLASRRRRKERRARLGEFGVIEFYLKLPKKIKIKSSRKEKLCIELTCVCVCVCVCVSLFYVRAEHVI
jgi:hypothetical protein